MQNIIEASGLTKSYGTVRAVREINFFVKPGSLFAFLGVNGAGKSTTIDMLCTRLTPDGGKVVIDGHTLGKHDEAIRRKIGIVFQDHLLDNLLTVAENLRYRGGLYGLDAKELKIAIEHTAQITGVEEILKRPYGKLSGGQRRRVDIARALINTPHILFLDEPTTGLDPATRQSVWQTIRDLQKQTGMTVFLTTHYMEEAAEADYITIIDKGEIKAQGTPLELRNQHCNDSLKISPVHNEALEAMLSLQKIDYVRKGKLYCIPLADSREALPILAAAKDNVDSFEVVHGTLDDVFIEITRKKEDAVC